MTQSYKDKIQPASFRDVQFFVKSHSGNFGRRVISHEFPFSDLPFTEDLGKKSRSFQIEGFLIGEDYFAQKDKLIAACEQFGSGILVHPYLGRLQINCQSLSINESLDDGGIANLSFQFIESGDALIAIVDTDKTAKLTSSTTAIKISSLNNFKEIYEIKDTLKSGIQKAKDALNQTLDNLNKAQKLCADIAQTGNDLAQFVRESSNAIDKIILFPDKVSALFESAYGALSTSIDKFNSKNSPKRLMAAASLLSSASGSLASPNTAALNSSSVQKSSPENDTKRRNAWMNLSQTKVNQVQILNSTSKEAQIEQTNKNIIELTTNALALSYLADAAASSSFASSDDVSNTRNLILKLADSILEHSLISDGMFNAIQNMQACLSEALLATENKLPLISIFNLTKNTNVLSFLYDNFENLDKEGDLISRNNIQDPFVLSTGSQLEVAV